MLYGSKSKKISVSDLKTESKGLNFLKIIKEATRINMNLIKRALSKLQKVSEKQTIPDHSTYLI